MKLSLSKVSRPGWFKISYVGRKMCQAFMSLTEKRPNKANYDKMFLNPERIPVSKLHMLASNVMYVAFVSPIHVSFTITHDFGVSDEGI